MRDLDYYREEIDRVDKELLKLFEKRMDIAENIGKIKKEKGLPILDPIREKQVLNNRLSLLENKEYEDGAREFFESIMGISRGLQQKIVGNLNIAFQGIEGSYGQEAALFLFPHGNHFGVSSFREVFERVKEGSDYGILPIENSSTGSINEVYDLLAEYDFYITGEYFKEVNHFLLGIDGADISDIKEVYSHEQGLGQCEEFIKSHGFKQTAMSNTAVSAKFVKDTGDNTKAAIAGERAAEIYGLKILAKHINTGKKNQTRFISIAKKPLRDKFANKISIAFKLPHISGSLIKFLGVFAEGGINLMKIESRPILDQMGEYLFFMDLEGNMEDEAVLETFKKAEARSDWFKYLGNYSKSK